MIPLIASVALTKTNQKFVAFAFDWLPLKIFPIQFGFFEVPRKKHTSTVNSVKKVKSTVRSTCTVKESKKKSTVKKKKKYREIKISQK